MLGYSFIESAYRGKGWIDLFYKARLDHACRYKPWEILITDHRVGNEPSRKAILKHGFHFTEKVLIDWPDGSYDRTRDQQPPGVRDEPGLSRAPGQPGGG